MNSIEAIQQQIDKVSPILKQLASLAPKPTRPVYGDYRSADGTHGYDKNTVSQIEEDINRWQYATKTVLATLFGVESEHFRTFERTIIDQRMFFDAKNDLFKEVNNGRNVLGAIIEAETLKLNLTKASVAEPHAKKPPKVFISHKKEDKPFADALVNLINFIIGPEGDKIFCSSVPGYGIRQSRDIMQELKAQFDNHEVFMIIIHSPRYYKSVVCLNEMGASWVLGTRFSSFMTKDCKPEQMQGVINRDTICIDLNDDADMLNAHLNEFKDDLTAFFDATSKDESKWENVRTRFLREVSTIDYESTQNKPQDEPLKTTPILQKESSIIPPAPQPLGFNDEEMEILHAWVESGNNTGLVVGVLGGVHYLLGHKTYFAKSGREEARWKHFLDRLQKAGFVAYVGLNSQKAPVYELQNAAYEYFEQDIVSK
jgi:hypothetical protein